MDEPSGWSSFEGGSHPACILDGRLHYRRANAAWEARGRARRVPGSRPSAMGAGRPFLDDVDPSSRQRWEGVLLQIVGGRLGHHAEDIVEATPAGERRVAWTASPTLGADGRPDGVLVVLYEVADAALAGAAEADALARTVERHALVLQTARRLQHFLGNQLSLTMGYVELMTIDPQLPTEMRERVDEALRGVVEATETLTYLRRLAREEVAPDDPELEEYLSGERG